MTVDINPDAEHIDWLRQKLDETEQKLMVAEAAVARLRPLVFSMRATLDALMAAGKGELPPVTLFREEVSAPCGVADAGVTDSDTKARRMPHRRPEYANVTNVQAAKVVLDSRGPLHVDEITQTIFDIQNRDQFLVGKRNVTTELIRGARKGIFTQLGGNVYASANRNNKPETGENPS